MQKTVALSALEKRTLRSSNEMGNTSYLRNAVAFIEEQVNGRENGNIFTTFENRIHFRMLWMLI